MDKYEWIQQLIATDHRSPVIVGGDFNAKNALWGYSTTDCRGRRLEEAMDISNLRLGNEPHVPTRVGLHARHADTTPDLTLATPGAVKHWQILDTTWNSDHFPISIRVNNKWLRAKKTLPSLDWQRFREMSHFKCHSFQQFVHEVTTAKAVATEEIECSDATTHLDDLVNMWKRASVLPNRYRTRGQRHKYLQKLCRHYNTILHTSP